MTPSAIRVLHVIHRLSRGGASRALITTAAHGDRSGGSTHVVASLVAGDPWALESAREAGLQVVDAPDPQTLNGLVEIADIVQVHYWNTPELLVWMRELQQPARLLTWSHVPGDVAPHLLTPSLVAWADVTLATSPYTTTLPVFAALPADVRAERTGVVLGSTDFDRLTTTVPRRHEGFNVGYIGTVDVAKMHPEYVAMSAAINVPDIRFPIYGSGDGFTLLERQAARLGVAERFACVGFTEDIGAALATFDVFGYPVHHASSELVLQEAMYVGVPPVVFAAGGCSSIVAHGETGLVVTSAEGYARAIRWLYDHPEERQRLGANAAEYARRMFGASGAAVEMQRIYARMMAKAKRIPVWADRSGSDPAVALLEMFAWGSERSMFHVSRTSTDRDACLAADRAIAQLPPIEASASTGGILHYRRYFPDDPWLRLWSGLVLVGQGRHALAIAEFEAAERLGLRDWRVSWYVAEAARACGADAIRRVALRRVIGEAPDFVPAHDALASMPSVVEWSA